MRKKIYTKLARTPIARDLLFHWKARFHRWPPGLSRAPQHGDDPLPNFSRVDERLYRGGQPSEEGFRRLKREHGVGLVVNLRREQDFERGLVSSMGLAYLHLPIADTDVPSSGQVAEFFESVQGSARAFVHCQYGSQRTSVLISIYRLSRGASLEDVLRESEAFGFDPHWLRGYRERRFIEEFARRKKAEPARIQKPSIE